MNGISCGEIIGSPYRKSNAISEYFPMLENVNAYVNGQFRNYTPAARAMTLISSATGKWLLDTDHKPEELKHIINDILDKMQRPAALRDNAMLLAVALPCAQYASTATEAAHLAGLAVRGIINEPDPDNLNAVTGFTQACWSAINNGKDKEMVFENHFPDELPSREEVMHLLQGYDRFEAASAAANARRGLRPRITGNPANEKVDLEEAAPSPAPREFASDIHTVLQAALVAIDRSDDYESAVRKAVALGGNSDLVAGVTGALADALYGVPANIQEKAEPFTSSIPDADRMQRYFENANRNKRNREKNTVTLLFTENDEKVKAEGLDALKGALESKENILACVTDWDAPQEVIDTIQDKYGNQPDIITEDELDDYMENLLANHSAKEIHTRTLHLHNGELLSESAAHSTPEQTAQQSNAATFDIIHHGAETVYVVPTGSRELPDILRALYGKDIEIITSDQKARRLESMRLDHEGFYIDNLIHCNKDGDPVTYTQSQYKRLNKKAKEGLTYLGNGRTDLTHEMYDHLPDKDKKQFTFIPFSSVGDCWADTPLPSVKTMTYLNGQVYDCFSDPTRDTLTAEERQKNKETFLSLRKTASDAMHELAKENGVKVPEGFQLHFANAAYATVSPTEIDLYRKSTLYGSIRIAQNTGSLQYGHGEHRGGEYLEGALAGRNPFDEKKDNAESIRHYLLGLSEQAPAETRGDEEEEKPEQLEKNADIIRNEIGNTDDPLLLGCPLIHVMNYFRHQLDKRKESNKTAAKDTSVPEQEKEKDSASRYHGYDKNSIEENQLMYLIDNTNSANAIQILNTAALMTMKRPDKKHYIVTDGLDAQTEKRLAKLIADGTIFVSYIPDNLMLPKSWKDTVEKTLQESRQPVRNDIPKTPGLLLSYHSFGNDDMEKSDNAISINRKDLPDNKSKETVFKQKVVSALLQARENTNKTYYLLSDLRDLGADSLVHKTLQSIWPTYIPSNLVLPENWAYGIENINKELSKKQKETRLFLATKPDSMYRLKDMVAAHDIDIVIYTHSIDNWKEKTVNHKYIQAMIGDKGCRLVDGSKQLGDRNTDYLDATGTFSWDLYSKSPAFTGTLDNVVKKINDGTKILILGHPEHVITDGSLYGMIGKAFQERGIPFRYIDEQGKLVSHSTLMNGLLKELDLDEPTAENIQKAYSIRNQTSGYNPAQAKASREAGKRYRTERQEHYQKLKAIGSLSSRIRKDNPRTSERKKFYKNTKSHDDPTR